MFGLAGFEFRKVLPPEGSLTQKGANLRHRRCRAEGSWRDPSLAPSPGWARLGVLVLLPPNQSLTPHWGRWCWVWHSAGLAPGLRGLSLSSGAHSPNPFGKENTAMSSWIIESVPSPEPPATLSLGLSMSHNSRRKAQWGRGVWVVLADMIQFKILKSSFGITSVVETAKIPSLKPVLPILLIWPQSHTGFYWKLPPLPPPVYFSLPRVCHGT